MTADFSILNPSQRAQLIAIQGTQSLMNRAQLQLASGRDVNSALDNPNSFFASRALNNRADDLQRLLDAIGQNLQVIEAADNALQAAQAIVDQGEAFLNELRLTYSNKPADNELSKLILEDNPVGYWQLNETSGNVAVNQGSGGTAINGTYHAALQKGADALITGGATVTQFTGGNNHRISIPDSALINTATHAQRTVELVFNADDVLNRQVLYEEGGTTNSFTMYVENGRIQLLGRDAGAWGPPDISADIKAGETYHVAFAFDFPNRVFTGYLNGEEIGQAAVNSIFPAHGDDIGIGGMNQAAWYLNGSAGGSDFEFNGRIGEVALYNTALTAQDMAERYEATGLADGAEAEEEFRRIMAQLDLIVADSTYKGINLLEGDDMITVFNEHRTSTLITRGQNMTYAGLGIAEPEFRFIEGVDKALDELREAREKIRSFGTELATDFAVLEMRRTFTVELTNMLQEGSDKLTLADQNEVGAGLLALQTRQQIQMSVLSFGANQRSIADFLI